MHSGSWLVGSWLARCFARSARGVVQCTARRPARETPKSAPVVNVWEIVACSVGIIIEKMC